MLTISITINTILLILLIYTQYKHNVLTNSYKELKIKQSIITEFADRISKRKGFAKKPSKDKKTSANAK